jgi:hypothetical protein
MSEKKNIIKAKNRESSSEVCLSETQYAKNMPARMYNTIATITARINNGRFMKKLIVKLKYATTNSTNN